MKLCPLRKGIQQAIGYLFYCKQFLNVVDNHLYKFSSFETTLRSCFVAGKWSYMQLHYSYLFYCKTTVKAAECKSEACNKYRSKFGHSIFFCNKCCILQLLLQFSSKSNKETDLQQMPHATLFSASYTNITEKCIEHLQICKHHHQKKIINTDLWRKLDDNTRLGFGFQPL